MIPPGGMSIHAFRPGQYRVITINRADTRGYVLEIMENYREI